MYRFSHYLPFLASADDAQLVPTKASSGAIASASCAAAAVEISGGDFASLDVVPAPPQKAMAGFHRISARL